MSDAASTQERSELINATAFAYRIANWNYKAACDRVRTAEKVKDEANKEMSKYYASLIKLLQLEEPPDAE